MTSSTPYSTFVFDIDGTLFDTKAIHQEAYRRVGVVLSDEDFGKPWEEWLLPICIGNKAMAMERRRLKQEVYKQMVRDSEVTLLGAGIAALHLIGQGKPVFFLTSSYGEGACALLNRAGLGASRLLTFSAPPELKNMVLKRNYPDGGVYVDDMLELGMRVTNGTRFSLQHYQGEGHEEVLKWMRLS